MPGLGYGLSLGRSRRILGFNPLSFSPLAWWDWSYTAGLYTDSTRTTLVSADGDPLGAISDRSGNNYHLTQTDGTAKGLYKTSIINGLSVGRTDGVNDFWQVASSSSYFNACHYGGATIFIACRAGTVNNADAVYGLIGNSFTGSQNWNGFGLNYDGRASVPAVARANVICSTSSSGLTISGGTWLDNQLPSNTPVVATWKLDPTNATLASRVFNYKNLGSGVSGNSSSAAASNTNAANNLAVGCRTIAGPSKDAFAVCDFYEILIYASLLSDANRALVTSYLMSKWGIV